MRRFDDQQYTPQKKFIAAMPIFYTTSEKLTPIQSHTARSKGRGTTLTVTLEGGAVEQLF